MVFSVRFWKSTTSQTHHVQPSREESEHMLSEYNTADDDKPPSETKKCNDPSHRYLQLTAICFSFALAFSTTTSFMTMLKERRLLDTCRADLKPKGSSFIPSIPYTATTFQQNELFAGPSTQEHDQAWNAMMPQGDGFIIISNPSKHSLPPGKPGPSGQGDVYDISLFHQLHCLAGIRRQLLLLEGSIGRNNSEEIQEILINPQWKHMYHCFDYIRQGLMCAGDMTIEWPREEEDGRRFAFDGWGIQHQCKSWNAIMKFMNEHDVTNYMTA